MIRQRGLSVYGRTRTFDLLLMRELLCRLSYTDALR